MRRRRGNDKPGILAIDIDGTHVKAGVVDARGKLRCERRREPTPYPCPPQAMIKRLIDLAAPLPRYDQISIGFPGIVRNNHVLTAPHDGTPAWTGYPLAAE